MIPALRRALIAAAIGTAMLGASVSAHADAMSPEAKLEKARADLEAKRVEDAARGFRDVAMNNPGTEQGRAAVEPYLRALAAIAADPPRIAALGEMERDIPLLMRLYCDGVRLRDRPEPCRTLVMARRDLAISRAPVSVMRPSATELEARAAINLAVWDDAGKAICEARQTGCEAMASLLESAAEDFEAAGKRIRAIVVRKMLVDPRYHLEKTDAYAKAMAGLGAGYEAFAAYEIAVTWYETLAKTSPRAKEAPGALERAVELRLLLDDAKGAREDAELFEKEYKSTRADAVGRIIVRIADNDAREGDWKAVQKGLDGAHRVFALKAGVGARIAASSLAGRAAAALGDQSRASREYSDVIRAWKDAPRVTQELGDRLIAQSQTSESALAAAINAHGEAAFFFAEQKRAEVLALPLPPYKGPDSREAIMRFHSVTLAPWLKKKRELIERAEEAYTTVAHIEPVPPPKWYIAAAARVGFLWADFVVELKSGPTTPESRLKGPIPGGGGITYEQLRATYQGSIQSFSEPLLLRAKEAFRACVNTSTRHALFDENSIACERWLAKTFPREHHALDELRGAPRLPSMSMQWRPATPD